MGRLIARERDNRDWLALQVRFEIERTVPYTIRKQRHLDLLLALPQRRFGKVL
jgi:hypothetical protein